MARQTHSLLADTNVLVTNIGADGRWRVVQTITTEVGSCTTRDEAEQLAAVSREATGAGLIAAERNGQIAREGYSSAHDIGHDDEELAQAAAAYVLADETLWPWSDGWKPTPGDRVRQLVKAAALVAAEIDRLQRSIP